MFDQATTATKGRKQCGTKYLIIYWKRVCRAQSYKMCGRELCIGYVREARKFRE